MHFAIRSPKAVGQQNPSSHAAEEINAYIAIRDGLMAEAEKSRSHAKLDRVIVANDFVETCLKPARAPYKAQYLREADAARERKRCHTVKARVAELRAKSVDRQSRLSAARH